MITRIQALNYRCLKSIDISLNAFHVLVGPNASGKTTFLDVVGFLGDLVAEGPDGAIGKRTENFQDLVWQRQLKPFELALELDIPETLRASLFDPHLDTVRYQVKIGPEKDSDIPLILAETVLLKQKTASEPQLKLQFPELLPEQKTLQESNRGQKTRTIVNKVSGGNDNFYSEVYKSSGKGWAPSFRLGPKKSALGNLIDDPEKFPVSTWLLETLARGVQPFILNSQFIRVASPPGQALKFKPDGSNLPWVVKELAEKAPEQKDAWIEHVRSALPDLMDVRTVVRPEDRHAYLMVKYDNGLEIPSWTASDGTLRLLALTLPAYLNVVDSSTHGIYLIEEPENGVHPKAVETVFQSLSSVYDAQILMATHSPVILSLAEPEQILCFAKTADGYVDMVQGNEHPQLRDWKGDISLGNLFASGVLG
ncbi:MAG: AAA family ATPase [Candidatus Sericytochromatia bacterium]